MNLNDWTREEPAAVVDLIRSGSLESVLDQYGGAEPKVLAAILARAAELGARYGVLEYRYIDQDYRNEHSHFYSTTFRRYPSVTHRLHFFEGDLPAELTTPDTPARFGGDNYLGYTILRPLPGAPVGRTMLAPPAGLQGHVTCAVKDRVNLLGESLEVEAMPFVSQDSQMSVCAHANIWMLAYYHHKAFGSPRVLPSDVTAAVPHDVGRDTPSTGLTLAQISSAVARLGFPAIVYALNPPPQGESLARIACRYLNSGLPLIVGGRGHAFVLVGYRRIREGFVDERIQFIRHDDEVGVYQIVDKLRLDEYFPWDYVVVPLPHKVYMSGEDAEAIGDFHLRQAMDDVIADPLLQSDETSELRRRLHSDPKELSIRSTVVLSNHFKQGLDSRGLPDPTATIYRRMHMSRWIWVVELLDRQLRGDQRPCVLAEAIIDATDHLKDKHVLSWRLPNALGLWDPDADELLRHPLYPSSPVSSVARANT